MIRGFGFEGLRTWLWAYYSKIPIYPIFYLAKGDYRFGVWEFRAERLRRAVA